MRRHRSTWRWNGQIGNRPGINSKIKEIIKSIFSFDHKYHKTSLDEMWWWLKNFLLLFLSVVFERCEYIRFYAWVGSYTQWLCQVSRTWPMVSRNSKSFTQCMSYRVRRKALLPRTLLEVWIWDKRVVKHIQIQVVHVVQSLRPEKFNVALQWQRVSAHPRAVRARVSCGSDDFALVLL